MSYAEALEKLKTHAVMPLWPETGVILGMSRPSVYAAAARGQIETVKIGKCRKTLCSPLRRKLGMEEKEPA